MTATVSTLAQTIIVDDVADILVTDVVQDGANFVREVRVFGEPNAAGPAVFILRLSSPDATKVKVSTPTLEF